MRWMKGLMSGTIAVCLLCTMTAPLSSASTVNPAEIHCTAAVTTEDKTIPVPVTQKTTQSDSTITTTVQIRVPELSAENPEYDADALDQIREKRRFTSPAGNGGEVTFADPGLITYTATLVYNVQTGQNDFRKYDLISFRLDREIYTMAPYNSVHNAAVRVDQTGFSDPSQDSGLLEEQSKDLGEIEYGRTYSKGNDWPDDWQAVGTASGSPQVGITYDVLLDYADGTSRTLSFTHSAH